jgi:hypothetical protein
MVIRCTKADLAIDCTEVSPSQPPQKSPHRDRKRVPPTYQIGGLEIRDLCDNRARRCGIRFVTQEQSNRSRAREVENTGGNRTPKLIITAAAQTGGCRLVPHNMYRDDDPLFFRGQFCDVAKSGDEP